MRGRESGGGADFFFSMKPLDASKGALASIGRRRELPSPVTRRLVDMEARKAKEHTWAKGRKYETKLYVPCFFNQVLHTEGLRKTVARPCEQKKYDATSSTISYVHYRKNCILYYAMRSTYHVLGVESRRKRSLNHQYLSMMQ